jgi:hypothetical protein
VKIKQTFLTLSSNGISDVGERFSRYFSIKIISRVLLKYVYKVGVVCGETETRRKFLKLVGNSSQLVFTPNGKKNMNMVCKSPAFIVEKNPCQA